MSRWYKDAHLDWSSESVRLITTPSLFAKESFFYVQEVGHLIAHKNYYTERDYLHSFLIVFSVQGQGYLRYMGKEYVIKPGEVFFINCEEYQFYRTDHDQVWELYFIHFYGSQSQQYYHRYIQQGSPVTKINNPQLLIAPFEQLIKWHQNKDSKTELYSSKWITDILTELISSTMHIGEVHSYFIPTHIKEIKEYIGDNYASKITLENLSNHFTISKYHLAREFKKYIGITPYEFLFHTRMNKAKELLKYTSKTIEEITFDIGINQVSHFIQLFKTHEDLTPLAYRKMWQKPD